MRYYDGKVREESDKLVRKVPVRVHADILRKLNTVLEVVTVRDEHFTLERRRSGVSKYPKLLKRVDGNPVLALDSNSVAADYKVDDSCLKDGCIVEGEALVLACDGFTERHVVRSLTLNPTVAQPTKPVSSKRTQAKKD